MQSLINNSTLRSTKMTWLNAGDVQATFRRRAEAVVRSREARITAEMSELDPGLPASGYAFHLAHNWHRCEGCPNQNSRRIVWLMDSFFEFRSKMNRICDRHWETVCNEVRRQEQSA